MYGFHVFKVFQNPKIRDFLRFLSCCTRFPERWLRPMTPPAVRQLARSTKHTIYQAIVSIALMLHCAFTYARADFNRSSADARKAGTSSEL